MRSLARRWPRFGYRRVARLLRDEGWNASETRILRLWRREGLKVPRKRRKKRGRGISANACDRRPATKPCDVWAWDFTFDRTTTGSQLKWLSLIDEFTRECLVLKVDRSLTAEDLIDTLAEQFAMRDVPRAIRSDNGPEFAVKALKSWLTKLGLEPL
ncbi:MAG TPA: DDE-type integrase/transposase/recombinase [Pirellulaceae bacterium]|jgi:transposase InsO family protein|nr:DDE-type integrase/transposase/recombinase [Pirellulaceae bacterium]